MRPLLILALLLFFAGSSLYSKTLRWCEGVIVLNNSEVLAGDVVIEPSLDLVLFRSGEVRTFYPVSKINFVSLREEGVKYPRKFISLQCEEHGKTAFRLYEVILDGDLSVIRRPNGGSLPGTDEVYGYDYFIMDKATIISLSEFRKKIYPVIENYYSEKKLTRFLSKEQLNPWSLSDAIKIINIYNDRLPIDTANISARK
ncbi:MAG TPA: hypothetical protein VFW11_21655 [Cyclobacteriaceae bacterium]|nr:hypothetical protein [Cyclobacteriaceae bacterium]